MVLFRHVSNDMVEAKVFNVKQMLASRNLQEDPHLMPVTCSLSRKTEFENQTYLPNPARLLGSVSIRLSTNRPLVLQKVAYGKQRIDLVDDRHTPAIPTMRDIIAVPFRQKRLLLISFAVLFVLVVLWGAMSPVTRLR